MMRHSGFQRELIPSLVGVGPLTEILPDLPLPSPDPSPLERTVLGGSSKPLDRLLSNADPNLATQITSALSNTSTSFLKLKSSTVQSSHSLDSNAPLIVKAIWDLGFAQPRILLKKYNVDPIHPTSSPQTSQSLASFRSADGTAPGSYSGVLSPVQDNSLYNSLQQHPPSTKHKSRHRHSSSAPNVEGSRPAKRGRPPSSSNADQFVKKKRRRTEQLVVSVQRSLLKNVPSTSKNKSRKKNRLDSSSSTSSIENISRRTQLIVKIPRPLLQSFHYSHPPQHTPAPYSPHRHDPSHPFHHHHHQQHSLHSSYPNSTQYYNYPQDHLHQPQSSSIPSSQFTLASGLSATPYPIEPKVRKIHKDKKHKYSKQEKPYAEVVHRFRKMIKSVLDQVEHTDSGYMLPRSSISTLTAETARLKQLSVLHQVSTDYLIALLSLMDRHVLDSAELLMNVPQDESIDHHAWREQIRERILRSLDASLVILHITTAPKMPSTVHLEESIELCINLASYHLNNNVYPEFDPVYRAESKDSGVLPRQKRRSAGQSSSNKNVQPVYKRLIEVLDNLALLLETHTLTDTAVLKLSTLGTMPFFVENVSTLQLSALKLVRAIFSRYEKHRDLILEDIFTSLARLPTTKRNLRNFRLSNGANIQMLTALILQLVQCILMVPKRSVHSQQYGNSPSDSQSQQPIDISMIQNYELALRTGNNFLSTFMKKCCGGKDEDDFRPLFDNFVQDLLSTLGLPEWPASEVLLTLLGMLLVAAFSNRSNDQQLRVTALDHLGVIAARLRRDAVSATQDEHQELIDILAEVLQKKIDSHSPVPSPTTTRLDAFSENTRHLRKALVAYLTHRSETDPSCIYARDFYAGQWLRDNQVELERTVKGPSSLPADQLLYEEDDVGGLLESSSTQAMYLAEQNKDFLLSLLDKASSSEISWYASILDEKKAVLVTRYLSSGRALSRSFDKYLQQLLRVLNEPAVHVRTRAMKALSTIVAADPSILLKSELQRAVHCRFLDQSTSVREAAVDLIGRFVLQQPELTPQYYEMLLERILDTGVSVRKRVIKILKDICITQPDFPKINDICFKMIRRINDEEGIKQLVSSVFSQLWFTMPPHVGRQQIMSRRVANISAVVSMSKEYEWFEQLLHQLLKSDESKTILEVCQMMVDSLMENLLSLDESSDHRSSSKIVACVTTLYLFCKIKPLFLLRHTTTLHPYLSSKCTTQNEVLVLFYVAHILEAAIPLMELPSPAFLASVEEDIVKLIMKHGAVIVQSCVSCLGVIINQVTHNYTLAKDCFLKFYSMLEKVKYLHSKNPKDPQLVPLKTTVLRSVFTVGLFCKHFDMDTITDTLQGQKISHKTYSILIYFCNNEDQEIQLKSLVGLGFLCIHYPEKMLTEEVKELYLNSLGSSAPLKLKCQVMKNLQTHLLEVEASQQAASVDRTKGTNDDSLVDLGDQYSSVSSSIAQKFMLSVVEAYSHTETPVRVSALQVISLILRQGLVHPGQFVPFLMASSTDPESSIKVKAEVLLTDHYSRFGNFLQTHLVAGIKKAYQFQLLLTPDVVRGSSDSSGSQVSLLSHLYTLMRSSKSQRRAFLKLILRHFEDYEKNPLGLLLFLADGLAHFPFSVLEEPLFILHNIDMTLSVTGSSLLQAFRNALGSSGAQVADDEDESLEQLSQQNCDLRQLNAVCRSCQACVLLLVLKQNLKKSYGLTDKKCQQYSPNEKNLKAFERPVTRKQWVSFEPVSVLEETRRDVLGTVVDRSKEECIRQYLEFKKLMNLLDPLEGDDDDSDQDTAPPPPPPLVAQSLSHSNVEQYSQLKEMASLVPTPSPMSRRRRSRSRASSTSSTNSNQKKKRGSNSDNPTKNRKSRRIFEDSDTDSDDDDPSYSR